MRYYHVTNSYLQKRIEREGLIGNPVVYLTNSMVNAKAIRSCQERLGEAFGDSIIFQVDYDGEVFIDPHVQPLGTAWMVYADLPPNSLQVCY
jgi:hypothetical protein